MFPFAISYSFWICNINLFHKNEPKMKYQQQKYDHNNNNNNKIMQFELWKVKQHQQHQQKVDLVQIHAIKMFAHIKYINIRCMYIIHFIDDVALTLTFLNYDTVVCCFYGIRFELQLPLLLLLHWMIYHGIWVWLFFILY